MPRRKQKVQGSGIVSPMHCIGVTRDTSRLRLINTVIPEKSDFADIATSAAIQGNLPMGKGLQEFYQSKGFGESVKNLFAHDYGGTLLELVAESMGSYIPSVVERAPARVAAGAAIGAGVGATALGAGAAPGALTGASWG